MCARAAPSWSGLIDHRVHAPTVEDRPAILRARSDRQVFVPEPCREEFDPRVDEDRHRRERRTRTTRRTSARRTGVSPAGTAPSVAATSAAGGLVERRRAPVGEGPRQNGISDDGGDHDRDIRSMFMTGEPRSSSAPAFRATSPATTTGNTSAHHTTPRKAGSASRKKAREPEQLRPCTGVPASDEITGDDHRRREEHDPAVLADRRRAPTRSPCARSSSWYRSRPRMPRRGGRTDSPRWRAGDAAPTAIVDPRRGRRVSPILQPREPQQQRANTKLPCTLTQTSMSAGTMAHNARGFVRRPARIQSVTEKSNTAINCGRIARFWRATQKPATLRRAAVRVEAPSRRQARKTNTNATDVRSAHAGAPRRSNLRPDASRRGAAARPTAG